MNELRDELRSLADRVDLPPTTAAEGAWAAARSRVRRRRTAALGGAAALVVVVGVGLQAVTGVPSELELAPLPPTGDSLVDVASEPVARERLDPLLGQALPERVEDREVVPLADQPLEGPAAYAVGVGRREVHVIGADGVARSITGLETIVNGGQPLRNGSLSPEATLLALPQPGRLLVVDLLDGAIASVEAGGISTTDVAWVDDDTVAVFSSQSVRTLDVPANLSGAGAEEQMRASLTDPVSTGLPVTGGGSGLVGAAGPRAARRRRGGPRSERPPGILPRRPGARGRRGLGSCGRRPGRGVEPAPGRRGPRPRDGTAPGVPADGRPPVPGQ